MQYFFIIWPALFLAIITLANSQLSDQSNTTKQVLDSSPDRVADNLTLTSEPHGQKGANLTLKSEPEEQKGANLTLKSEPEEQKGANLTIKSEPEGQKEVKHASITIPVPMTVVRPLSVSIGGPSSEELIEEGGRCNKDAIICANLCRQVGRSQGTFESSPSPNNPDGGSCLCRCKAVEDPATRVCGFADINSSVRNAACSTFCRQNDQFKYSGGSCHGFDCICDCYLYDPFDSNSNLPWNWSN